ncbi:cobaltochelatase subunit CobN [Paracoccus sp. Z330]|uniref:Cobaltochelatase subunit CobN n=1 Tax=Paracoccus onchidii TaxID=3017813 RepID=A0ABT4ZCQ7_9RHOB|nr:cobaltochelatase subunit CobN [Paracoccus onchidii]MDB6177146.1 cobaltochelatase subunit CobN [Paracoccus onchidii]
MHVVFRESHGLEEADTPFDPGQSPADLVVLSYSDSDLGAFAAGWHRAGGALPTLRLCNLVALRHPVSVDTYVEQTLGGAKAILVRLIGGESYWSYGLASLRDHAMRHKIALAVLPADGRDDPRLDDISTVPRSVLHVLRRHCDNGGPVAAQAALAELALAGGLHAALVEGAEPVPEWGFYDPDRGILANPPARPCVLVPFYRSYLTAADTAPIDALIRQLVQAGVAACGVFVPSLKAPGLSEWLGNRMTSAPIAIINATGFSVRAENGATPFDAFDCPVFQVALSTNRHQEWAKADRGLSPADLAMHVVLPEVDGRLFLGLISCKAVSPRDPDLEYSRFVHQAMPERISAAVRRVLAWCNLSREPRASQRIAMVLSTYPGRDWQMAHAVGLDALASADHVAQLLRDRGYRVAPEPRADALDHASIEWPLDDYLAALSGLPAILQDQLAAQWGDPTDDPACGTNGFRFGALWRGNLLLALQPDRGHASQKEADYHDLTRVPRHAYVAFYLWLRSQGIDAMIHMGAHGTLEWLPGKSVALGQDCWPDALLGTLPVVYPFIVNDPGEAAQAKRRIGAVTLGHMPPPLIAANVPDGLLNLERLLDEYSTADGLDPRRRERLTRDIRDEAVAAGVAQDLGIPEQAGPAEVISRIDRFVCDIKESQFGDGLHVFATGPHAESEAKGLMAALSGAFVPPGPSGSPARGRHDVVPTGRNLFSVDPRGVPTPAAQAQGVRLAEELLRRHLQDHGDWPRGLVVDLWGSATMRTAGEEFSMALHLAGLAPVWDQGAARVTGIEVIPLALLDRPRIDVTLRVSGLFRDVFPTLAQLFETGAEALAQRDEDPGDNPYGIRSPRVFGPQPGQYGLGLGDLTDDFSDMARQAAGEAWLNASSWAIGQDGRSTPERAALEARLSQADSFVHAQDLRESDLLLAADYAGHEAGFAAALARIGAARPALYHLDNTRPDRPSARSLTEEIARTVRARAAQPQWADSMMRHGFRGAAEIAATLDHLAAFAHLAQTVPPHLFDLYHSATLGRPEVVAFMDQANPAALCAMRDLFDRLAQAGLWVTRSNSIAAMMGPER